MYDYENYGQDSSQIPVTKKKPKRHYGVIGAVLAGVVLVSTVVGVCVCTERIPAGYVGVVYSMNGGVQDEVLHQGWNVVSPTKKVKEFTISNEQIVLSKDSREGSEEDDSFAVATADNANINISFQMSYRFDESMIVDTYKNFKGMDGEAIVNGRVRTVLKSLVSETTTGYSMMDLYSGNRAEINNKLTDNLNKELHKQFGIEVINASIIDVHPDAQLQKTISDRVTALQQKQKAEAEQQTIKVQNDTAIMKAKAEAEKKAIEAQARAEVVRIEAEAQAEANRKLAQSLTPDLVKQKMYEKWDGHLPQFSGGGNPIIDLRK